MFAVSAFEHVLDTSRWEFFETLHMEWEMPSFHGSALLSLTKFRVLMLAVAVLLMAIFIPLARKAQSGRPVRGLFWNAFESILTFIRDQLAKPYLGHDADKYVHYLWTVFFFILFCNLFGLFPFMGSPTAAFTVTIILAACTYVFIHGSAIAKMGFTHYLESYVPHLDVPFPLNWIIPYVIAVLEFLGNFIKAFVLAVRLFANMFAGHVVLAFILLFIVAASHRVHAGEWGEVMFWGITASSVIGVTLLSLLELFVAFLQAYVFTFLTAIFLGSTLHPQH